MASNSSFDFLHVHGLQRNIVKVNMKTDNIATNPNTNAHIRPSLNDSERDHGGTSLLIMSDVCNKDGINISLTNISISSIDFLSLEKFSLLILAKTKTHCDFHSSYLICFTLAYHGPNAGVLGNVGNSYWHYEV